VRRTGSHSCYPVLESRTYLDQHGEPAGPGCGHEFGQQPGLADAWFPGHLKAPGPVRA
jgi:hypothetical protein